MPRQNQQESPDNASCANCRFWQADGDGAGSCRRRAPAVLYDVEDGAFCLWPMTEASDWCGDHERSLQ